jgi:hypothetical protein
MNTKNFTNSPNSLASLLLFTLVAGCTHVAPMSVSPTNLPVGERLPLHATLVLSKEFTEFKQQFSTMGDTFIYPLGQPLADYARHVTEASFRQVEIAPTLEQALQNASSDILLIPRAVKADQSLGFMRTDQARFTLVIEWVAKRRADQNTVWIRTITGDASETKGVGFSGYHQQILMQKLFDDLSLKTQDAFQKAPELRGSTH